MRAACDACARRESAREAPAEGESPFRRGELHAELTRAAAAVGAGVPVDYINMPYRVNSATLRPLRAFKPPFSRAPTLQHQLPGSGEPSHALLRRVVLAVSLAFKNWATFGRRRNSALVGELWH